MATIVDNQAKLLIMQLNAAEALVVGNNMHVETFKCYGCTSTLDTEVIFYIALYNKFYCPNCLAELLSKRVRRLPEMRYQEMRNYNNCIACLNAMY